MSIGGPSLTVAPEAENIPGVEILRVPPQDRAIMPNRFVALSLSLAVRAVLRNEVGIEEISLVVASTTCKDATDWDLLFKKYKEIYWYNGEEGERIARTLLSQNKVVQPRLSDESYSWSTDMGTWIRTEDLEGWKRETRVKWQ